MTGMQNVLDEDHMAGGGTKAYRQIEAACKKLLSTTTALVPPPQTNKRKEPKESMKQGAEPALLSLTTRACT